MSIQLARCCVMFRPFVSKAQIVAKLVRRPALVFCIGAGGVASYVYCRRNTLIADGGEKSDATEVIKRRKTESASDALSVTLYQYRTCPFCCKVRSFLDYFGIPYEEIEVNPLFKREMKFSERKAVPFVIVNNVQVSKKIIVSVRIYKRL